MKVGSTPTERTQVVHSGGSSIIILLPKIFDLSPPRPQNK